MSDNVTQHVEQHDTIEIYIPQAAAETEISGRGETILTVLAKRASDAFGGFTTYEGTGGWQNEDGNLIRESVTILRAIAPKSESMDAEVWAKVNARWMKRASDESMVMATVNDRVITVE